MSNTEGLQFTVHNNVSIKCLNKNKKVIRDISIHNKATINLVEGILRFLRGDFTPSEYTTDPRSYDAGDAYGYIPTEIRFGNPGVVMKGQGSDHPRLYRINSNIIKRPTFDEYKLQKEITSNDKKFALTKIKFESSELVSYNDTNNSMALSLTAYIPPGQLVGLNSVDSNGVLTRNHFTDEFVKDEEDPNSGQGWAYWNPDTEEWESVFTEIGLYSGSGALLARVAFDGETYIDYYDNTYVYNVVSKATKGDKVLICNSLELVAGSSNWELSPDTAAGNAQKIVEAIKKSGNVDVDKYDWISSGTKITAIEKSDEYVGKPSIEVTKVQGGTLSILQEPNTTDGRITFVNENSDRNPIIQSDTSSIIVEWVIGIVSVGQNDEIISGAELNNFGMDVGLTAEEVKDRISGYDSPQTESEILGLVNQINQLVDHYITDLGHSEVMKLDDIAKNDLITARDDLNELINRFNINI